MNWGIIRVWIGLLAASIPTVAADAPVPELSASYQILQHSERSGQTQVQLRVHFTNLGSRDLHIQRLTLWDFGHPTKGASRACSVVIRSSSSAEVIQNFSIPRAEYELWRRGAKPRIILEFAAHSGQAGRKSLQLDRTPNGKGN